MMKAISAFFQRLPSILCLLTGLLLVFILCLLTVFQETFSFVYQNGALASNALLFFIAMAVVVLCMVVYGVLRRRAKSDVKRDFPLLLVLCSSHLLLFLVQWGMVRSLWFYAGWDVSVVRVAAEELARGMTISSFDYFQMCPANAPLTMMLSVPYWIGLQLKMVEPYVLLPLCGAACINLSCLLGTLSVFRLTKSRLSTGFCFALSTVFILLSPYVAVAYSDAFAILFPVLALYLSLTQLKSPLKWFLIALVSGIGSTMKPTALIFFIALIFFMAMRNLASLPWKAKNIRRFSLIGLVLLLGLLPRFGIQTAANITLTGSANSQDQLTHSHYLMTGFNQKTYGGNSLEDELFSRSFLTISERESANYQRTYERLSSMSAPIALRFFSAKLYKAFGSGSFAWNGSFLLERIPQRSDAFSLFLRKIYYTNGAYNRVFISVYQVLWLFSLALGVCGLLLGYNKQPLVALLGLTILGVAIYQLLFECWPRYLFLYSPFFVILTTLGLRSLCERAWQKFPRVAR